MIECVAMGRLLCAVAIGAAFLTSGCVAHTVSAWNVDQTSAQLRAFGHSDDSPAHVYFRYADDKADLGTAAAHTTPLLNVPAHVPQSGNVTFWENVTGLSPGRLYWYAVCGGDAAMSPDLCAEQQHFLTTPTAAQDSVQGQFRFAGEYGNTVTIEAASGPQGQDADGWLRNSVRYFGPASEGQVICLAVNGDTAVVGVVGTAYDPPSQNPHPYSALWTLNADDQTFHEAVTQGTPSCANASFAQQEDAFDWTLGVNDAN
jgi:hypothetical protein